MSDRELRELRRRAQVRTVADGIALHRETLRKWSGDTDGTALVRFETIVEPVSPPPRLTMVSLAG